VRIVPTTFPGIARTSPSVPYNFEAPKPPVSLDRPNNVFQTTNKSRAIKFLISNIVIITASEKRTVLR
jgi:hypothetical protein